MAKRVMPYPNLELEMVRTRITREDVAHALGKSYQTVHAKMVGDIGFTLDEAFAVKNLLKTEMSLEELFKKA